MKNCFLKITILLLQFGLMHNNYCKIIFGTMENELDHIVKSYDASFKGNEYIIIRNPQVWFTWNSVVWRGKEFIEDNSKNMLGIKDSLIMKYLNALIKAHKSIEEVAKVKWDELPTTTFDKIKGAHKMIISKLSIEIGSLTREMMNPSGPLNKLLKKLESEQKPGKPRPKKLEAIIVLKELGFKIYQVLLKVLNNLN